MQADIEVGETDEDALVDAMALPPANKPPGAAAGCRRLRVVEVFLKQVSS